MNVPPNIDTKTIQSIIVLDFPDLKIDSIQVTNNGWDNMVVEVNDHLIFRFPKNNEFAFYKDAKTSFDIEVRILDILKDKISLQIPKIEFLGKAYTYMGYRKIPGGDLTYEIFDSLNTEQKERVISDVATFLHEIHNAISSDKARIIGVADVDVSPYSSARKAELLNKIKNELVVNFIEETVQEYDSMMKEEVESVFLYNDLHTENMAFDATAKKLNGVFDFSDIMVGDVNLDFQSLYKFNPSVMKAVAEKYQELADRKLNLRRMVLYGRVNELSDLAEFIDKPESTIYKNAMMRIQQWNSEMDLFK